MADSVDAVLSDWARISPELDVAPVAVIARLGRVRAQIEKRLDAVYAAHGISAGDFAALSILWRAGEAGCPMGALADSLYLTGGTVSVRVTRLVERGWAQVSPSPADARTRVVAATGEGRRLFAAVLPEHLRVEHESLAALSESERRRLAALLGKLLTAMEQDGS